MKLRKSLYGMKYGGMVQFTMTKITVWNGHTQLKFAFSYFGQPKAPSFPERLVFPSQIILVTVA